MLKGRNCLHHHFTNVNIWRPRTSPQVEGHVAQGLGRQLTRPIPLLLASVNPPGMTYDTYQRP
jgi:hypothetical protein